MTRRSLTTALVACLIRYLVAQREAVLERIEANGWKWDSEASRELEQIDEALTRIGFFDTHFTGPRPEPGERRG